MDAPARAATVAVFTKRDLTTALSENDIEALCAIHRASAVISAKTGEGLDDLAATVGALYDAGEASASDAVIWSAAQAACVTKARELLAGSAAALRRGEPTDAACTLAESALESLMRLDGRGVSEEIVATIFSRFCVGK